MSSNKLALLRERFATGTTGSGNPAQDGAKAKRGRGTDVRAIVLKTGQRPGRKPFIQCFLHDLPSAKVGERDSLDGTSLTLAPKTNAPDSAPAAVVTPFTIMEVCDNSKDPPSLKFGDAIWLCNLTANVGASRTFYDASFTKQDTSIDGYAALASSSHSLYYVPRFDPKRWDNDVLLPIAPLPTDDNEIKTPGVYARIDRLDDSELTSRDGTIYVKMSVVVSQWKNGIDVDAVSVRLPNIRCWASTLCAFGIQNVEHWEALAPVVLPNCAFFLKGYVHKPSTTSMLERMDTSETDYALSCRVTGLNVDPHTMLRLVGLKVPSDYAVSLIDRKPVSSHVWNDNTQLPITNLSESDVSPASSADFCVVANIPDIFTDKASLDALDDAGRQDWLQSHWGPATVACVFQTTKKRSAANAGL